MSNFLSKLVGHSLSASEAIQPRVPSIYEPYRRGSAPHGAEFAGRERSTEPGDQIGAEANAAVPSVKDESSRAAESRPQEVRKEDLAGEEVRGRSTLSRHPEVAQEMQAADERERPLRLARAIPVVSERERSGRPASESHPLSAVVRRPQVEGVAEGEIRQNRGRAGATSGAFLRRLPSDTISRSAPAATTGPISSSGVRERRVAPGANANPVTATTAAREIRAGELPNDSAWRQSRRAESANADVGILSESSLRETSFRESLVSSRIQPVTMPTQAMPTRTIPAAVATQGSKPIDLASARGPANHATDSEPAMRVTIGRVEVRAVFPASAPRRAQPARPRPTLSLDGYLKRDLKRPGPR